MIRHPKGVHKKHIFFSLFLILTWSNWSACCPLCTPGLYNLRRRPKRRLSAAQQTPAPCRRRCSALGKCAQHSGQRRLAQRAQQRPCQLHSRPVVSHYRYCDWLWHCRSSCDLRWPRLSGCDWRWPRLPGCDWLLRWTWPRELPQNFQSQQQQSDHLKVKESKNVYLKKRWLSTVSS